MKELIKKIVVFKLNILAKMYLARFKPQIIAVTGNVGKTSTKEAISVVLGNIKKVRSGKGNLNNEFGVPLTIVGDWADDYYEAGNSMWFWIKVLWLSFFRLIFSGDYPEILVLEYGADKPGDIKRLAKKFKPHIGVITAIGEIPVHVEYFSGPEELAREKRKLIEGLDASDFAVLNFDDLAVLEMREKTKAKVLTYGLGQEAEFKASDLNIRTDEEGLPMGLNFKIHSGESFVPVNIFGSLGKSQGYAAAAAAAVGMTFGMNLIQISDALSEYHGPKGRLKILKGIKNSVIIDDTYNASPASTHMAIETVTGLSGPRRIAVLGDMLELGRYTIEAHEEVGNFLKGDFDVLVTVGSRAKFIAESALNQMPKENIHKFETSDEAKLKVKELIREGDLVLVKGSQGIRMEKIVEEIMAEPDKKKELLVRQGKKWLKS
ncbi:MAG: UDP-N-acetylmuramoyl-tripeptide--D-alanyl-D-alanine ligase [Candidatus Paceibacterota bacterium]